MRKRFVLLGTGVLLLLALMLPATTAASSPYSYKTVYNYCNGDQVNLKMKNIASGASAANKLTIESWAQRKTSSGWQTVFVWNTSVYKYAWNGAQHTLTAWRSYNGNNVYFFRIIFRLGAWRGNTLLASSSFKSVNC